MFDRLPRDLLQSCLAMTDLQSIPVLLATNKTIKTAALIVLDKLTPLQFLAIIDQSTPKDIAAFLQYFIHDTRDINAPAELKKAVKMFVETAKENTPTGYCIAALISDSVMQLNPDHLKQAHAFASRNNLTNIANTILAIQNVHAYPRPLTKSLVLPQNCYLNLAGADLQYADLTGLNLSFSRLNNADLSWAIITFTNFYKTQLNNTQFFHRFILQNAPFNKDEMDIDIQLLQLNSMIKKNIGHDNLVLAIKANLETIRRTLGDEAENKFKQAMQHDLFTKKVVTLFSLFEDIRCSTKQMIKSGNIAPSNFKLR